MQVRTGYADRKARLGWRGGPGLAQGRNSQPVASNVGQQRGMLLAGAARPQLLHAGRPDVRGGIGLTTRSGSRPGAGRARASRVGDRIVVSCSAMTIVTRWREVIGVARQWRARAAIAGLASSANPVHQLSDEIVVGGVVLTLGVGEEVFTQCRRGSLRGDHRRIGFGGTHRAPARSRLLWPGIAARQVRRSCAGEPSVRVRLAASSARPHNASPRPALVRATTSAGASRCRHPSRPQPPDTRYSDTRAGIQPATGSRRSARPGAGQGLAAKRGIEYRHGCRLDAARRELDPSRARARRTAPQP